MIAGLRGEDSVAELCPDGVVETVNVASPNNLRNVKVGDQIVITLTKVMAISLVKETGV